MGYRLSVDNEGVYYLLPSDIYEAFETSVDLDGFNPDYYKEFVIEDIFNNIEILTWRKI
jgi:hypothetical protein